MSWTPTRTKACLSSHWFLPEEWELLVTKRSAVEYKAQTLFKQENKGIKQKQMPVLYIFFGKLETLVVIGATGKTLRAKAATFPTKSHPNFLGSIEPYNNLWNQKWFLGLWISYRASVQWRKILTSAPEADMQMGLCADQLSTETLSVTPVA